MRWLPGVWYPLKGDCGCVHPAMARVPSTRFHNCVPLPCATTAETSPLPVPTRTCLRGDDVTLPCKYGQRLRESTGGSLASLAASSVTSLIPPMEAKVAYLGSMDKIQSEHKDRRVGSRVEGWPRCRDRHGEALHRLEPRWRPGTARVRTTQHTAQPPRHMHTAHAAHST